MVTPFRPAGLFAGGVDPLALQAAMRQRRTRFQPRAPQRLPAPTNVIKTQSPLAGIGKGMAALGQGIGALGQAGREKEAREALAGAYAPPPGVSGPEGGPSTFAPGATTLQRLAFQFPDTKAGAMAQARAAQMASADVARQAAEFASDAAMERTRATIEATASEGGLDRDADVEAARIKAGGSMNTARAFALISQAAKDISRGVKLTPDRMAELSVAHLAISTTPIQTGTDALGRPMFSNRTVPSLEAMLSGAPAGGTPSGAPSRTITRGPAPVVPAQESVPVARTPGDQNRIAELRTDIREGEQVIRDMNTALKLSQQAYSGPLGEAMQQGATILEGGVQLFNPDYEIAAKSATTEMERIILKSILPRIKKIFGAAPSAEESKMILRLGASVNMSEQERKTVIEDAIRQAQRRLGNSQKDLKDMMAGQQNVAEETSEARGPSMSPEDISKMTFEQATEWAAKINLNLLSQAQLLALSAKLDR